MKEKERLGLLRMLRNMKKKKENLGNPKKKLDMLIETLE